MVRRQCCWTESHSWIQIASAAFYSYDLVLLSVGLGVSVLTFVISLHRSLLVSECFQFLLGSPSRPLAFLVSPPFVHFQAGWIGGVVPLSLRRRLNCCCCCCCCCCWWWWWWRRWWWWWLLLLRVLLVFLYRSWCQIHPFKKLNRRSQDLESGILVAMPAWTLILHDFVFQGFPRGNTPLTIADSLQGRPFGTLTQQPALVAMAAWPLWISRLYVPGELRIREDSEHAFRFYLMMRKRSPARYEPSMIRTMENRVQSCQTCDLIEGICVPADCGAGALPVRTDPSRLLTHINLQPVSVDMCYLCFFACWLQKQEQGNNETHCYTIILWNSAYLCSDFWRMFVFGVEQVALGPLRSRSRRHAPRASFAHFATKWNPIIKDIEGNGANGVSRDARF